MPLFGQSKGKIRFWIIVALLAALLFSSCSLVDRAVFPHKDRTYSVTETYGFNAPKGVDVFFDIDLPMDYGYQQIKNFSADDIGEHTITDENGYRVLHGQITGSGSTREISLKYEITLPGGAITWTDDVKPSDTLPGQFVDSDNNDIIAAAEPLITNDEYRTAKNIFDYVSNHLKFVDQENDSIRVASDVLQDREGVCEDFANLMTAMLRASDIPAKSISGMTFRELKKASQPWEHSAANGSHAWVEFFVDGEWHFADPTWGKDFFDDADGFHASYGLEPMIEYQDYIEKIDKIEAEGYQIPLSITAPSKITVWTVSNEVEVFPTINIEMK
jgi:hypothetical protein